MKKKRPRNEGQKRDRYEMRLRIYRRDNGVCRFCGDPVDEGDFEIAHRIAEVDWAIEKYGWNVIDHDLNKALTHRDRCNSGMLITFNPVEREKLVSEIREVINT